MSSELGPKARALLHETRFADEATQADADRVHAAELRALHGVQPGAGEATAERALATAPEVRAPASPTVVAPEAVPPAAIPVPALPVASSRATPARASAEATPLDAEVAMLREARQALREGRAARALALLDEHARRFPHGVLAEDCAAERVFALCALGSVDQARAEGLRFLAGHALSPHADAVRASCGVGAR
jgi:hypothetical protein